MGRVSKIYIKQNEDTDMTVGRLQAGFDTNKSLFYDSLPAHFHDDAKPVLSRIDPTLVIPLFKQLPKTFVKILMSFALPALVNHLDFVEKTLHVDDPFRSCALYIHHSTTCGWIDYGLFHLKLL